jgi:photosystem II stability/assembly factor-like uncharacterized protein
MFRLTAAALLLLLLATAIPACGEDDAGPGADDPVVSDPGPVHVHGLGTNPRDGALFIATHTGLFRAARGESKARRVGDRYQDTMGFTIVGPDRFLGSGHPDGRDQAPPFLGLIRSDDAGETWRPVSLRGRADFHVLEAAGESVYGFGSDWETRRAQFLVSADGGRGWDERDVPEPLTSLTVDPRNDERIIVSGERALYESKDGGRAWKRLDGPPGLLDWHGGLLVVVTAAGEVMSSADATDWQRTGEVGGEPAAFEAEEDDLYVALHDGTIKRSTDAGRSWTVRSKP